MSPSPKILANIQARMASSRLPGKVLLDIAGKPMLQWVVERARMTATVDQVVVATTTDPSDDPVADFCGTNDIAFTRGHPYDVLDRYVQAARQFEADIVVRITADCPLIDPGLVDVTVRLLVGARLQAHPGRSEGPPGAGSAEGADVDSESGREPGNGAGTWHPAPGTEVLDFAANRLPPPWGRTYPIGLDVEVATKEALELAWGEAKDKHYREHVMPYFYDDLAPEKLANGRVYTTPRGFRIAQLHHDTDHGAVRWTVDTPEDLAAVRVLVERLPAVFTWLDALETWQAHPEIAALNAGVSHKTARDVDRRA